MSNNHGVCYYFDHVKGMVEHLRRIAGDFGITISQSLEDEAIEYVVDHYYDHIDSYNVRVTDIDPYKFTAWAGMYFFRRLDNAKMLSATVAALRRHLKTQNKSLDFKFCQKLVLMAYNDEKKDSIAIGKNGLYMAFRTASEIQ